MVVPPDSWKVPAAGALVLASVVSYALWQGHKASNAAAVIQELQDSRKMLDAQFIDIQDTNSRLNNIISSKEVAIAQLRETIAKLPKPKPPVPVPAAPEEQVRYFQSYHLSPMVVPGVVGGLAFPSQDIPVIGKALQDSGNLPRVSQQLRDTELLVQKLDGLGAVKDARISAGDTAIGILEGKVANCDQINVQYRKQLDAQRKQSRAEKLLWGAAGIGVGFLVAKR